MSFDDEMRAHQEHLQVGMRHRKFFAPDKLTAEVPEPYTAPPEDTGARMSHATLDEAEKELAAKYGHGTVNAMVYLTHASASLGRSENERHVVLYEVERALRNRESQVPAHKVAGLRDDVLKLAASQGTGSGPDDSDRGEDEVALAGTTQETRALRLAAGGQDSAEAVVARHPELSYLFRAGKTSSRRHPRKSDVLVTTDSRAHSSDLDDDTRDSRQPGRGGKVHADVKRLIQANPDLFADEHGREGEGTGNTSYAPRTPQQREAGQRRAEGGSGGRGGRSIPDFASGSARMYGR